jgi:hypothetical protein
MKELGERFLTQYVPTRCKPSTQAEHRCSVELFLDPFFAKQHVRSLTTADVAKLHGSLSHIPYQANRTLGVLSKMMNLAETWGMPGQWARSLQCSLMAQGWLPSSAPSRQLSGYTGRGARPQVTHSQICNEAPYKLRFFGERYRPPLIANRIAVERAVGTIS